MWVVDEDIVVATTRPETMLGDTGVAINPLDPRAARLHPRNVKLPLTDREIPIVLDDMADLAFGSGAVKITPAHDPNDFEAGKRHDLPSIQVIGEDAKMTAAAGKFAGLDRYEARKRIVAELQELGYLVKIEPYKLNVGKCHRCKTVVEPLVSKQWWMKMKPLAAPAIAAVEDGRITFVPANWSKTYFEWMYNIRDWCISRQLWWGHRIPAWYCGDCKGVTVARETPTKCSHCGSAKLRQETDVLDTWFSSGLWPFSTLGWPDDTADLRAFYPTTLLVTGFDIIFFWAARMIMLGMEMMGDVPFRQVHIHGLVRDAERQKMSKTKGNVIDPLVVNDKYGTDAVRFGLLVAAAPGNDIALSEEVILRGRKFANKIWNASGLLFSKDQGIGSRTSLADRWIGSRLNTAIDKANKAFEHHRYHEAADAVWTFFWDEFCDWYLELKKSDTDWGFAYQVHEKAMLLLHPLMPFITEELWHRRGHETSIALEAYPQYEPALNDPDAEREMKLLQDVVTAIRESRADHKIDRKMKLSGRVSLAGSVPIETIERLTNVSLDVRSREGSGFDLKLDLPEAAGTSDEQKDRLKKDSEQLEKVIANSLRQLGNESFVSKAPAHVIDGMRAKLAEYQAQFAKNQAALTRMNIDLPGRRVEWFPSLDSTMTVAARLAREGCASGTVVGADEQTAGIGRAGHSWHSEPDAGLYVSIVLRLALGPESLPLVMLALGLATRDAIADVTGLAPDLRWPNDVLLGEKKCAGILAQMEGDAVIAGIGINVGHASFPPEIAPLATSLMLAGASVSREEMLGPLVDSVDASCGVLKQRGPEAICKAFGLASTYAHGRRVRVDQDGLILEGVTRGLDPCGFLLLRQDNGTVTKILAGGVRPI